jgi:ParB/RepB/Spo0J family partition protein
VLVELELRQLQRKYANLRVTNRQALGRLVASLSEVGQQSPVLVVMPAAGGQPVLIDGYRRVAALERLARDTVQALQLGVDEAEALLLRQRMGGEDRRSALEDGWLLRELQDAHGVAQRDLATRLGKSTSWVSRRLGLVRELPDPVQDLVRRGTVPAHAAMKYLLPLARANAAASERLTGALKGGRWSVREIGQIYETWRKSKAEVRARIESHPREFCRALAAVTPEVPDGDGPLRELVVGVQRLGGMCRRLLVQIDSRLASDRGPDTLQQLSVHWQPVSRDLAALAHKMQTVVTHD